MARPSRIAAVAAALAVLVALPAPSLAANDKPTDKVYDQELARALNDPEVMAQVGADVKFYFGATPDGVVQTLGRSRSHKKSRASRGVEGACARALGNTLAAMARQARGKGANAIVNIRSFWGGYPTSSATSYKCGIGSSTSGVALVGEMALVK
jgi:uncharacterized protein YbjQ (UPF0145 family)